MTQGTLEFLDHAGVDYEYINIEEDPQAREWVKQQNDGKEKKPTVQIGDRILSEPSDEELEEVLTASGKL
jgi:mycoredoxin